METPLTGPPARLERVVLFFTPSAAREEVAGDLWERYRSPRQYALEALRTLPFVVASRMRRDANFPVIGLQGVLVFCCFGALAALAALCLLLLQSAYQGQKPPSASRAALETILVAMGFLFISLSQGLLGTAAKHGTVWSLWPLVIAAGSLPVLSLFRTRLVLESDRRMPVPDCDMTMDEMARDYLQFAQRSARRNQIETALLFAAACAGAFSIWRMSLPPSAWSLTGVYGAAGIYLSLAGAAQPLPGRADFLSLRAHYSHELARQNQLRRFIWWLWLTPLLLEIYVRLIGRGIAAGQPLLMASGTLAAMLLCFVVITINSERNGRIQESIVHLARMRERSCG
jgi:hypothetical protein